MRLYDNVAVLKTHVNENKHIFMSVFMVIVSVTKGMEYLKIDYMK